MTRLENDQRQWISDKTEQLGVLTKRSCDVNRICEEFERKFKRSVSQWTVTYWSRKFAGGLPVKRQTKKQKSITETLVRVLESANFILYVFPNVILGYDTKEEVREYLEKHKPEQPFRVFVNHHAEVKTSVEVII